MRRRNRVAILLAAMFAVLVGSTVLASPTIKAASMSIQILSPANSVSVPVNGKIHLRLAVKGIRMDLGAMGRKNVSGEGHYHFYVDCIPPSAYKEDHNFGNCWAGAAATLSPTFDLSTAPFKISPGTHLLLLALAQNDHVLYQAKPAVLSFTVVQPAARPMSIQILSPTHPVTVGPKGKIHLRLAVKGITLDMGAMGRKNVYGRGHYHFYVDCIPSAAYARPNNFGSCWAGAEASLTPTFDLSASPITIKPGTHILLVALAQNDHVLYTANASDVVFTVTR